VRTRRPRRFFPFLILCAIAAFVLAPTLLIESFPATPETAIRGVVRDSEGHPIAGARIQIVNPEVERLCPDLFVGSSENLWRVAGPYAGEEEELGEPLSVKSNDAGRFELAAKAADDSAILIATAEGFPAQLARFDAQETGSLVLERGSDLTLALTTYSEEAVEEGEGTLVPLFVCTPVVAAYRELMAQHARSDSGGRLQFRNVLPGTYAVRIVAKKAANTTISPLLVRSGRAEFRVRMPYARSVKGTVHYPARARHSAGRVLAFWNESGEPTGWAEAQIPEGEESFELTNIPSLTSIRVQARMESGLASREVSLEDLVWRGETLRSSILLRYGANLRGRVQESLKAPKLIAEVQLPETFAPEKYRKAVSVPIGPGGSFEIPDVPPEALGVHLTAPGYGDAEIRLGESDSQDLGQVEVRRRPTLGGRVVWEDQSPLREGTIEIFSRSASICRSRLTSDGEFACALADQAPADVKYQVRVGEAIYRATPQPGQPGTSLVVSEGESVQLTLSRPGGRGKVQNARLALEPTAGKEGGAVPAKRPFLYARSSEGKVALHLPEVVSSKLSISDPAGGSEVSVTARARSEKGDRNVTATVPIGASLAGTVIAAGSGRPLEGAEVEVRPLAWDEIQPRVSEIIHALDDGSWRREGAPKGGYLLVASARGYASASKWISVPEDSGRSLQFRLESPGRLHGKLVGAPKGSSGKARIFNCEAARTFGSTAEVDSKGEFTFDSLPPSRCSLLIRLQKPPANLYTTRSMRAEIRAGETTEVQIDLQGGIALSGRVSVGEKPSPLARVAFDLLSPKDRRRRVYSSDSTKADAEGNYEITLPTPGSYRVMLEPDKPTGGVEMIQMGRPLVIQQEGNQRRDLRFSEGAIRGRIVDPKGRSLTDVRVRVSSVARKSEGDEEEYRIYSYGDATTQEDGGFEIRPFPEGKYQVALEAKGFGSRNLAPISIETDQEVDLGEITLESATSLRIVGLDPRGTPLDKLMVAAYSDPDLAEHHFLDWKESRETGEVTLASLSPGIYTFIGIAAGLAPAILENVKIPSEDSPGSLVLKFSFGGSLDLDLVGRSGGPIRAFPSIRDEQGRDLSDSLRYASYMGNSGVDSRLAEGHVHFDALLAGEYTLWVTSGKGSEERKVRITEGQNTTIKIVLPDPDPE
jgi:carboxypeptidase family protein